MGFEDILKDIIGVRRKNPVAMTPSQQAIQSAVGGIASSLNPQHPSTDDSDMDQFARDVLANKRTPPFAATPEWNAAMKRAVFGANTPQAQAVAPNVQTPIPYGLNQTESGDDNPPSHFTDYQVQASGVPNVRERFDNSLPQNNEPIVYGQGRFPAQELQLAPQQKQHPQQEQQVPQQTVVTDPRVQHLMQLRQQREDAAVVHPNKWKDALFGALQGVNQSVNGVRQDPRTYSQIKADRRTGPIDSQITGIEHGLDFDQQEAYRKAQEDYQLKRPDIELAKIQQRADAAKAVTRRMEMNIDFRKGEAKPFIDEQGRVWKQFTKDPSRPMEPLENPVTHEQEVAPGEEGIQWTDPTTKQTYTIKAKQAAMPSATIASGNANRQQSADKENAEKTWQTDKENINNQMQYQNQVNGLLTAAVNAESGVSLDDATQREIDAKREELNQLYNSPLPGTDADVEKEQAARMKRVQELTDDIGKLTTKQLENMSKTEAGKAKAAQIRAQINKLKAPGKLAYTPYKPTLVTAGQKIAQSADVDAFAKTKGWTRAQAESYLHNNGWTIQ